MLDRHARIGILGIAAPKPPIHTDDSRFGDHGSIVGAIALWWQVERDLPLGSFGQKSAQARVCSNPASEHQERDVELLAGLDGPTRKGSYDRLAKACTKIRQALFIKGAMLFNGQKPAGL